MPMVRSFAELGRTMIRERTAARIDTTRAKGRTGDQQLRLDQAKQREIAESISAGRKTDAEMARLYNVRQPTASRIVAEHRVSIR